MVSFSVISSSAGAYSARNENSKLILHINCFRDFRLVRLWSATQVLSAINLQATHMKCTITTLTLVAGIVWFINGLHSAPANDQTGRKIASLILPRDTDSDEDYGELETGMPYCPCGIFYLRTLCFPPVVPGIRFLELRPLDDKTFQNIYNCSPEQFKVKYFRSGGTASSAQIRPPHERVTKKTRSTCVEPTAEDALCFEEFNDDEVPASLPEYGPGTEEPTMPVGTVAVTSVSELLQNIWRQYPSDIFQKLGNPKSTNKNAVASTYSPLSMDERQNLTLADINKLELGGLFNQVQWRRATKEEWQAAFGFLFPTRTHVVPKAAQHYKNLRYYDEYRNLLDDVSDEKAGEVREKLWELMADVAWIPGVLSDKVWVYGKKGGLPFHSLPAGANGGPRILINPSICRHPTLIPSAYLAEEEEESSSD